MRKTQDSFITSGSGRCRKLAKMTIVGIENYTKELDELAGECGKLFGQVVYYGAEVVADAVKESIHGLPIREKNSKTRPKGVTVVEKQGLLDSFGIAKMQKNGDKFDVRLGFDGYNEDDKPNSMIARSVESGTSWLVKTPFIQNTARKMKPKAQERMREVFDNGVQDIMK